ncbi:MAG TPA: tail fiber domain-containing protein, partial [Pyrinomonadaceae bacterium]|nr:tail fiber domain-containing protein [Pyrinomonadaceae bacterium]
MRLLTLARPLMLTLFIFFFSAIAINAQTTAFTYQGKLTDNTSVGNGTYDLQFALYDALTGGNQLGTTQTHTGVTLNRGVFTVDLDFGSQFPGADRWLEISVKKPMDSSYTTLNPRQKINSVPYAVRSITASTADSLSSACVGCVADSQINSVSGSKVTGTVANATNAATATTAATATNATNAATASSVSSSAGDSVVTAINAGSSAINTAKVSGDVELAPSAQQTTSSTNHLINLKLVSTDPVNHKLGTPGANALISLSASGTYKDDSVHDKERFRVDNDGSILSVADYTGGINTTSPIEGSGTRFMWYATKAALRAGQIDGTQWDDANIGLYSTAFGQNVRALGDNAIAVGKSSVAANTGTVALGEGHTATGANSIALGYGASTSTSAGSPRLGTFVFADRSTATTCPLYINGSTVDSNCQFHPTVTNSFNVRAVNGSFFYTNTAQTTGFIFNSTTATMTLTNSKLTMASDGSTTLTSNSGGSAGVTLPAGGGGWNNLSDRNMKDNFKAVNPREILRGVLALPISTWNYKTQDASIRHIGAMAQDFSSIFGVGDSDKTISTIDPDGIAFAAIQGLYAELKERDEKIE